MNRSEKTALIVLLALLLGSAILELSCKKKVAVAELPEEIRAVVELTHHPLRKSSLVVGFNYELLHRYAQSNSQQLDLLLCPREMSYIDSLRSGAIDILVLPYSDSLVIDDALVSTPIDSSSVWLTSSDNSHIMSDVNSWIDSLQCSSDFQPLRDCYMRRFEIFRSRPRQQLSPFDAIIKVNSDSIGMDWRMLAAVIYKESRFHIETRSTRGAYGLMQMMPSTAAHYGVGETIDPEAHIRAGSRYLSELEKLYTRIGANEQERIKFALAAYNAGIGRIEDMLRLAEAKEINIAYWDSVKTVIPLMSEELLDTNLVRFGPFKGVETLAYVDDVLSIYEQMKRVCQ